MPLKDTFNPFRALAEKQIEYECLTGIRSSTSTTLWNGLGVGDRFAWDDHFIEAAYPNILVKPRRLIGELTHVHRSGFNTGLRMRIVESPDGDPLKPGDCVFRWGETINHSGKPQKVLASSDEFR